MERRFDALEQASGNRDAPVVYVCLDRPDEARDEAVASYQAKHPDVPAGARFVVVGTGIYRVPGSLGAAT